MKGRLERWALRFDSLSLRERAMIFVAVAVLLSYLTFVFVIQRQAAAGKQLQQNIESQKSQIAQFEAQQKMLEQARNADVDAGNRERLKQAQEQLSQLEVELSTLQKGLVSADRMPAVLEDVLRQHQGLQMVELRTLPVTSMRDLKKDDKAAKPASEPAAVPAGDASANGDAGGGGARNLYKHGFEVTVRGTYPEFVQYLAELERLPTRMYWSKVTMNADDYPRVTMTVTIYTLSLDKAWLAV